MSVRPARADDVAALVAMAERFHAAAGPAWPFAATHVAHFVRTLIASPEGLCLVLEHDGVITGALLASFGEHPFAPVRYGMEWGFWIDPEARAGAGAKALLEAYRDAAKTAGCALIGLASLSGETLRGRAVGRLFRRLGFSPREQHYDMAL